MIICTGIEISAGKCQRGAKVVRFHSNNCEKSPEYEAFLFLGRQTMYLIALEENWKIREISYVYAGAFSTAEIKYRPMSLISKNDFPIFVT
jgi:glucosamine 6-phosphate synthetase-like amidotransferase/phosphosugar isomerase protein